MSDPFVSDDALVFLDKLWAMPSLTLQEIATRMGRQFSVAFTQEQLRNAARRNDAPKPPPTRSIWLVPAAQRPEPQASPVRLVARGSYPVPVGGYKLGQQQRNPS